MLERLRQSVAGILAKILIGVLVISFAFWGIGDVFGNNPNSPVATIGSEDISMNAFSQTFQLNFNQLRRDARAQGEDLTVDETRQAGLDNRVLFSLINQAILIQAAEKMGLTISDKDIIKTIRSEDNFQGAFGGFDRLQFENTLRSLQMTEQEYFAERRKDFIKDQIITVFTSPTPPPSDLVEKVYAAQTERRIAEYIILKPNQIKAPQTPSEDALKDFIRTRATDFITPEKRRFALLALEPETFTKSIKIRESALRQEYNARLVEFKTPAMHKVQQLIFEDQKSAKQARQKISRGASFGTIAKQRDRSKDDIDLGWLVAGNYPLPEIEKAVLKLRVGRVSAPVKTDLGWVLLFLEKTRSAKQKSFSEVRRQLHDRLARTRAQDELDVIHDLIEDERAAGEPLAATAKKFPARFYRSKLLASADTLPKNLPPIKKLHARIFEAPQGEALAVAKTDGDGYYWLEITEIAPAATASFKQARAKALTLWKRDFYQQKLKTQAEKISERGAEGVPFSKLTSAKILRTPPLARFAKSQTLSEDLLHALFSVPRGGFFNGVGAKPDEIIVARLAKISHVRDNSENRAALKKRLRKEISDLRSNEMLAQYIQAAQKDLGLDVYQNNIDLVFEQGRTSPR